MMKRLFIFLLASSCSIAILAQANPQAKGKNKAKDKSETVKSSDKGKVKVKDDKVKVKDDKGAKDRSVHESKIWEGTHASAADGPKPSKNQPAKVRAAFMRDYPGATNVYWSKYRGDWTATFANGPWMSTAVYHANGARKDTRTVITRNNIPGVILDDISKRTPDAKVEEGVEIDVPNSVKKFYRLKKVLEGRTEYTYYDSNGVIVKYDY